MTKNEATLIKEYILSRCVQQKTERKLVPQVTRRFNVTNGIVRDHIRKLKNEGLLCVPKKNTLKII